MENLILLDWLSATRPRTPYDEENPFYNEVDALISDLGLTDYSFTVSDGVKGFGSRYWFDGINIHSPSSKLPYLWLEMSGSGCRAFETYGHGDWLLLLRYLIHNGWSIKRLDIAHDDHSGILDMPTLINDTLNELYVSKSNKHEVIIGMDDTTHERDCSIYHGSKNSNTLIRIYDKAKQLELSKEHWIRTEIQLRDDNAQGAALALVEGGSIGDLFTGVLVRYLRYIDNCDNDSNKWRWPIKDYWANLVDNAVPICVAQTPGVEYNFSNLENYVFHQAGNAIKTYIDAFGVDKFLDKVREFKPYITNPKYRHLLEEIQNA